jgi:hypothetical protein
MTTSAAAVLRQIVCFTSRRRAEIIRTVSKLLQPTVDMKKLAMAQTITAATAQENQTNY